VAMPAGRLAAVKVTNPNPGTATSAPIAVPVRVAVEAMPYANAVRFLEMTTWGPTPQNVVDLQTIGQDAWLAAQFARPASQWPDPDNTTRDLKGPGRVRLAVPQFDERSKDEDVYDTEQLDRHRRKDPVSLVDRREKYIEKGDCRSDECLDHEHCDRCTVPVGPVEYGWHVAFLGHNAESLCRADQRGPHRPPGGSAGG